MAELKKKTEGQLLQRLVCASSIHFRKSEYTHFLADRDDVTIVFDRGIFTVECNRSCETVWLGTPNAKFWVNL